MAESPISHDSPISMSIVRAWLPHPWTTVALMLLWLALANSFSYGNMLIALVMAVAIPIYTSHFWPERKAIASPIHVLILLAVVFWDILVASLQVSYTILFKSQSELRSVWIVIPLDLTSPEATVALASIISLTPGTISSDFSNDKRFLLVHCLDLDHEESLVASIKNRYEKRLRRIFG